MARYASPRLQIGNDGPDLRRAGPSSVALLSPEPFVNMGEERAPNCGETPVPKVISGREA